jgi:xeroderma pigmentosum group C-complementing protein
MLMGLRIVQRMERDYADAGGVGEEINPFVNKALREGRHEAAYDDEVPIDEEEMAGGFFKPGHEEEEVPQTRMKREEIGGGGFFAGGEEEQQDQDQGGGGFLVEEGGEEQGGGFMSEDADNSVPSKPSTAPVSLQMLHKSTDGAMDDDDDEFDEDDDEDVRLPVRNPIKSTKQPATAKPKRQSTSQSKRKLTAPSPSLSLSEDGDEDAMSDLSDVSSDMGAFKAMPERRASSPQVIITPRKTNGRATNGKRSTRKATPVKSPYFSSQVDDEDEEDGESDAEVIKPRGTTARTRRAI